MLKLPEPYRGYNHAYVESLTEDREFTVIFCFLAITKQLNTDDAFNRIKARTQAVTNGKIAKAAMTYVSRETIVNKFPVTHPLNFIHPTIFEDATIDVNNKYDYIQAVKLLSLRQRYEFYLGLIDELSIPLSWMPNVKLSKYITQSNNMIRFELEEQLHRRK